MKITLCGSCALGQSGFADPLGDALKQAGIDAQIAVVDCMSGCARASTIAFRDQGKTAYLFGEVTADDLPDLITFARLYHAALDGNLSDARPLGALRSKAIARIPA
jgi:predicted metal-binding protein